MTSSQCDPRCEECGCLYCVCKPVSPLPGERRAHYLDSFGQKLADKQRLPQQKDWKSELGFEIVKHEPEGQMPVYLVREDFADDREATITERVLWDALVGKTAASGEPVAHVSECEACFTPDACQLRGTCDHYAAEKLRIAATAQPAPERVLLTEAQIKRAVEAGWLAALKCHAEAGMAGWSAEREAYIADAIEAAHCIPAPDARVPLTLRQISDATHGYGHVRSDYVIAIARTIEAAHGITTPGAPDAQKSEPEKSPETLSHTDLLQLRGNL